MSNIKVGSRIFRDVEKMDLDGLTKVINAISAHQHQICQTSLRLCANGPAHSGTSQVDKLDVEMKILERRLGLVRALAKKFTNQTIPVPQLQNISGEQT
jgi:hypothetical protein